MGAEGANPVPVPAVAPARPSSGFPLTSLEVGGRADAGRVLRWYGLRWRGGDRDRILRFGCRAGHLTPRAAGRVERAVAARAVIAWRLAAMVMMGRETPELPAGVLFSDIGIMALADFATDRRLPQPGDLGPAFIPMAMHGGHLNRGKGAPPGQTPSSGAAMARTYGRLVSMDGTGTLYKKLRPDKSCVS